MVNTGKPSKGCYMCRARRIKCDEGKPSCMRCQKSKRVCPGYRDTFELSLRDETKTTKKKMSRMMNSLIFDPNQQIRQGPQGGGLTLTIPTTSAHNDPSPTWSYSAGGHSAKSSISSLSSITSMSSVNSVSPTGSVGWQHCHAPISPLISTPVDEQAACFFLSNFVLLKNQGTMRGYMDFVVPLLNKKKPDPALSAAFSAVAIASLGTRPNSKALLPQADLCYVKALTKINSTLRDPRTASSDSALAAVLLMSVFEQVTAPRLNQSGWNSHVDGAVALLKSRGPQEFQNDAGREMWHCVRAVATIQCIANSKPADPSVEWWMSVRPKEDVIYKFASMNLRLADLRNETDKTTSMVARTAVNYEKVMKLLRRAEDLEEDYSKWFRSLPLSWQPKSETWIEDQGIDYANSEIHPGRIDSYAEMWIAYHQNIARSSRILIWSTILRCVAWLCDPRDYRLAPEYAKAQQVCRPLIEDIVASCPYFFSWNGERNEAMADKSFFACGAQDPSSTRSLWGIFVMWPLFVAAASDFALPSQRLYLRGRLNHISSTMGVYQASVLLKAPLLHPSFHIARERRKMNPHTCHSNDTTLQFDAAGVPKAEIRLPEGYGEGLIGKTWAQEYGFAPNGQDPVILDEVYARGFSPERWREYASMSFAAT